MTWIEAPIQPIMPHRLWLGEHLLRPDAAPWTALFAPPDRGRSGRPAGRRALAFIDRGLLDARPDLPDRLRAIFDRSAGARPELVDVAALPGGEACKNDPRGYFEAAGRIDEAGIDRHSYVLALGGGAVLDLVGFAAATTHRGVGLIRLPSTTLAQADSGVGVKCGINFRGKKNLLGAFAAPTAVLNDVHLLTTLDDRDWRGGFSEAVKVALVKDRGFFEAIRERVNAVRERDLAAARPILERSARLHFEHIVAGGDPYEQGSSRPLDLGHWSAHKLEALSRFTLGHGEAVAIGIAIDCLYAAEIGRMPAAEAEAVLACLEGLGFELSHPLLGEPEPLLEGLEEFREHLGGPLTLIMPSRIGRTFTATTIVRSAMVHAIGALAAHRVAARAD